jgi:hypothetical protein
VREQGKTNTTTSWADVVAKESTTPHADEDMAVRMDTADPENLEQQHAEDHSQAPLRGTTPD